VDIFRKVDTMSKTMAEPPKTRRSRRRFDDEFKEQAVRLVLDQGKSVCGTARDLDLTESSLRTWVERARAERGEGRPGVLTSVEREELGRLRKEVRELRTEREILKPRPSSRSTSSKVCLDRGGEGLLPRQCALSRAGRVPERLLCLVATSAVSARATRPAAAGLDSGVL
jgi:transposase